MKCSLQCILATTIVPIAFAQFFDLQVPKDLAVDVDSDSLDFFISFDGNAEEDGFISSAGDDSSDVASAPDFYVSDIPIPGDSINLLVGMIRTTANESRSLHWLISETRYAQRPALSLQKTFLQYQAPGTNNERGIQQYIFVLWTAGPDVNFDGLPVDQALEDFDVRQFEQENNLKGPLGVVDIVVEVEDENEQEVDEVADNESCSEDEDADEIIDNNISSDVDDTDVASAFHRVSRLAPVIIYSSILGVLLM